VELEVNGETIRGNVIPSVMLDDVNEIKVVLDG